MGNVISNYRDIAIEDQSCLLCGSDQGKVIQNSLRDVEEGLPGSYSISQCCRCGFIFLSRRPAAASLAQCYGNGYHASSACRCQGFTGWLYDLRCYLRLRQIKSYLQQSALRILEIGCGDAKLLTTLERALGERATLFGLDYAAARLALPAGSKIKLLQGDVQSASIEGKFDLILMYDVLEHLADPIGSLRRMRQHLEPDGVLIGQVPNWNSLFRRLFPRCWSGLQVPRHMSFFTAATLQQALSLAGLVTVRLDEVFDPGDLSVSLCNALVTKCRWLARPRRLKLYIPLTIAVTPLVALQNLMADSGEMLFVAKLSSK